MVSSAGQFRGRTGSLRDNWMTLTVAKNKAIRHTRSGLTLNATSRSDFLILSIWFYFFTSLIDPVREQTCNSLICTSYFPRKVNNSFGFFKQLFLLSHKSSMKFHRTTGSTNHPIQKPCRLWRNAFPVCFSSSSRERNSKSHHKPFFFKDW